MSDPADSRAEDQRKLIASLLSVDGVSLRGVTGLDVPGYLARLGLHDAEPPSAEALRRLHGAHVERVTYEDIEIQLGRVTSLDPVESARRIIAGRGGYCYHLNGAFAALLTALDYQVTLHRGGVQSRGDAPGVTGDHLTMTVTAVPDEPETTWLVDVGLGDGLHTPLPLAEGTHRQGPFAYDLMPSQAAPGGWRLVHDPRGSFHGMDFDPAPAAMDDFAEKHQHLSTSPESGFVRVMTAQRRDESGVDILRGLTLTRLEAAPTSRTVLTSADDWWAVLADIFGLTLDGLSPAERDRLWRRANAQHQENLTRTGS